MAFDATKNALPLRQTCNRCRDLKVRCQGRRSSRVGGELGLDNDAATVTISPCLRCARAGAVCEYASRQPSGRPRTSNKVRRNTSSSSSPEVPMRDCSVSDQTQPIGPLAWVFSPQGQWSEALSDQGLDGFSALLEEHRVSIPEFMLGHDDSEQSPDDIPTPPPPNPTSLVLPVSEASVILEEPLRQHEEWLHSEPDMAVFEEMKQLMELNRRIYEVKARAGTAPPTPGLCDDITSITRSLLRKMEQAGQGSRGHRCDKHPLFPQFSPGGLAGLQTKRLDAQIRRQAIDLSMYPEDNYDVGCGGVDASIFLYIYACYQRIFDLFKHVCLSIHTHIEEATVAQSSSTAQIVMGTELISHLSGRLTRGLHQLTSKLTSGASSSSPSGSSTRTTQSPVFNNTTVTGSSIWPAAQGGNSSVTCQDRPLGGHRNRAGHRSSCHQEVVAIVDVMAQRQAALQEHIMAIKQSIQESDSI